jgi:hypothetical protein
MVHGTQEARGAGLNVIGAIVTHYHFDHTGTLSTAPMQLLESIGCDGTHSQWSCCLVPRARRQAPGAVRPVPHHGGWRPDVREEEPRGARLCRARRLGTAARPYVAANIRGVRSHGAGNKAASDCLAGLRQCMRSMAMVLWRLFIFGAACCPCVADTGVPAANLVETEDGQVWAVQHAI